MPPIYLRMLSLLFRACQSTRPRTSLVCAGWIIDPDGRVYQDAALLSPTVQA